MRLPTEWRRSTAKKVDGLSQPQPAVEEIIAQIQSRGFTRIREKYESASPYPGYSKYLDLDVWVPRALERAKSVGIWSRRPSRILDLGAGAAYFPFICAQSGHSPTALDQPEPRMYAEITELLGIPRVEQSINAFEPLPEMNGPFDLVTAFSICFNQHDTPALWGVTEWAFLLHDIAANHATDSCQLHLVFNQEPSGEYYSSELREFFTAHDGVCDGNTVRMEARPFR